ncbi:MAG: signal peptidase II [Clostridia bacterium]|nr:signal peptidase II [Clostridia bacterium]
MILWTIIIILSVVLDQITKLIAIACLDVGESVKFIPGIINFTHIKNDGAAFGMLDNARWVFLIISAAAIIGLPFLLYKYRKVHFLFGFSLSLIIGGAIGNMIDRLFAPNGFVTDFIELAFMDFAIFNVADIFVCVGAFLMFIYLAFLDKTIFPPNDKNKKEAKKENGEDKK